MSVPDKERSIGGGGRGDSDENEDGVISPSNKDGVSTQDCGKESKRASIFRFGKAKKKLQWRTRLRKRGKKGSMVNSGCFGKWGDGVGMVGCCLCSKQPQTLDSSGESPCSDPNSKEFTYDMLRVLIEKNDFYAAECNPHLDSTD